MYIKLHTGNNKHNSNVYISVHSGATCSLGSVATMELVLGLVLETTVELVSC